MFLQESFATRRRKNPKYSLRAFAKALEVPPSSLSEILSGRRPISEKAKLKMGWKLGLSSRDLGRFSAQPYVDYSFYPPSHVKQLSSDIFLAISDWYHFAILELTRVQGFESSAASVARMLGISAAEAKEAVDRLFRLGLMAANRSGKWFNTYGQKGLISNIHPKATSEANKKMVKQILELSKRSVDTRDLKSRNHTGMTMAIHTSDLPKAIEKIKEFRRGLCAELERTADPNALYHMHIGLFPLTKQGE